MRIKKPSVGFFVSLLLILSACGGKFQVPKSNNSSPAPAKTPAEVLTTEIIDGNGPNIYSVRLKWVWDNSSGGAFLLTKKRVDRNDEADETQAISGESRELENTSVKAGATYLFTLQSISQNTQTIGTATVQIPVDYEFSGMQDLEVSTRSNPNRQDESGAFLFSGFHRVFFDKGARLEITTHDLKIVADEIISEDGIIESFLDNCKVPDGYVGVNGGSISITANTIIALEGKPKLTLITQPENGGDGLRGADGAQGAQGTVCGEAGGEGRPGANGERGLRGGNSGRIDVEIKNSNLLADGSAAYTLVWNTTPGVGGNGGLPGDPGAGGAGGPACPNQPRSAGAQGPRGPWSAVPGQVGDKGSDSGSCFKLGNQVFGCWAPTAERGSI